ncbi:hypothetical protein BCV39_22085 [Vibrio sp. 10N.286.55.E10]|nr:hypothetical protein BCV39_22085 [Vibrio sp. 10N.286.55.E10]PME42684.1 hypothetical protein BCV40_20945 [Vibrio sp. 10N.286.55.E12]
MRVSHLNKALGLPIKFHHNHEVHVSGVISTILEDESLFNSVVAGLITWVITLIITYFYSQFMFNRRFEKSLTESLFQLTNSISNTYSTREHYIVGEAKAIVQLYETHKTNYHSIQKIVRNNQLEELQALLEGEKPDTDLIMKKVETIRKTWGAEVRSIKNAKRHLAKELGL